MISRFRASRHWVVAVLALTIGLSGCSAVTERFSLQTVNEPSDSWPGDSELPGAEPVDDGLSDDELARYVPAYIGDIDSIANLSAEQLQRLNLVATNLVSVLVQIPELEPLTVTLQVARPSTPFGNVLLRAIEDAGLAMQLVSADQGSHYVSYGRRFSETDAGPVTDFNVSINNIEVTREYTDKPSGIYPASLISIAGSAFSNGIDVNDTIFAEQGGEDSFVSGTRSPDGQNAEISEVSVSTYDKLPVEKQTPREAVIAGARQHFFESDAQRSAPDLAQYDRYRRTVMIFNKVDNLRLGDANKRATRLLAREVTSEDIILIKACNDVDGVNELANSRAIRVEEELVGNGIPVSSVVIAPCVQTNYRHPTDDSPVPVEIVHYRPKGQ